MVNDDLVVTVLNVMMMMMMMMMMTMLWWDAANGHTRSPQWKGYDSPKIRDHFSLSRTHDTESLESKEHGTLATTTQPKVEIQTNFWKSENGPLKKEFPCEQRWEITALSDSEAAFWFKTGLGSVLGYQEPVWVQTVGKAENCRHVEWLMVNDVLLSFHLSLYNIIYLYTPLKINMEHNHGGLEDHFPF